MSTLYRSGYDGYLDYTGSIKRHWMGDREDQIGQDIRQEMLDRMFPLTNQPKSIPTPPPLSEKEALAHLEKACESDVGYNEAIIALRKHGWTISFNPTLTCDGRGGFAITLLPKGNYNVQKEISK